MKERHKYIDMVGFCTYFSHSAQVTRNAHETMNPAIAPGFSFLEGGARWWAIRFETGAIGNGKSSTLSPSAKFAAIAPVVEQSPCKRMARGSNPRGGTTLVSSTAVVQSAVNRSVSGSTPLSPASFTCSQDSPRDSLDVDSRIVRRTESTPAARALCSINAYRVARDWISEIDAKGR